MLAGARRRRKLALATAMGEVPPRAHDACFADDGQVFARPDRVEPFLETLDAVLARIGCARGGMPGAKSSVTLVGHPDALAALGDDRLTS